MKLNKVFPSDAEGKSKNSVCMINSWYDKIHKKCMQTLKCQDEGKGQKKVDTRTFINLNFPILMYLHKKRIKPCPFGHSNHIILFWLMIGLTKNSSRRIINVT